LGGIFKIPTRNNGVDRAAYIIKSASKKSTWQKSKVNFEIIVVIENSRRFKNGFPDLKEHSIKLRLRTRKPQALRPLEFDLIITLWLMRGIMSFIKIFSNQGFANILQKSKDLFHFRILILLTSTKVAALHSLW